MFRYTATFAVLVLAGLIASPAMADHHGHQKPDIVDTAVSAGNFKTLVAAVLAADLAETLKGDGPFTVFAPTDEAFAKLPQETVQNLLKDENRDQLRSILLYHVVPGKVPAEQVTGKNELKTVQGGSLKVKVAGGEVRIDDAKVIATDIETRNGIIHVIDSVVLPGASE